MVDPLSYFSFQLVPNDATKTFPSFLPSCLHIAICKSEYKIISKEDGGRNVLVHALGYYLQNKTKLY